MGKNCDWCIHRKRMSFPSQVHCQCRLHSFEQNISLQEKGVLYYFYGIFSPWLFDLTNSPQLEHLLHCSGLQLCLTCATFHLVKLMIFWSQGCTLIMWSTQGSGVWGLQPGHCIDRVSELIAGHEGPALSSSSSRHKGSLQHPLCLPEFTFPSHYLCLFLRFSLPWCTIRFPVAKPLLCPLEFPFYFLPLLTLGSISQLSFFIHPEHRSILLEERSGFAGEGHQGAVFEVPTLMFSIRAQKDRETVVRMMGSNLFFPTFFF